MILKIQINAHAQQISQWKSHKEVVSKHRLLSSLAERC